MMEGLYNTAQELGAGLLAVELNATHTLVKVAAPSESEYCKVKVWVKPDPELGAIETALGPEAGGGGGGGGAEAEMVHVPRDCQPLLVPPASAAHR